jgi:hypothetical protein
MNLPVNSLSCPNYNASFCPFDLASLSFAGTAHSVAFTHPKFYLVLDDITFGNLPKAEVPAPAALPLTLLGLAAMIGATRRRQTRLSKS